MRLVLGALGWAAVFSGAVLAAGPSMAQDAGTVSGPGCHFGEVIDGSTADDARRRIEAAGLTEVRDLKKSCDNFWHGKAMLNGRPVNVALSPSGKVILESN